MPSSESDQLPYPDSQSGAEEYANLPFYAADRSRALSKMLAPVVDITDAYGSLISRVVWALGLEPPKSQQDSVVRDLIADTFDFIWEWRRQVLEGKPTVAFPSARRAYESLSLLATCVQDADIAAKWSSGAEIGNAAIRKALSRLPFPEAEETLRELYRFFSKGAHPNRDLVAMRRLGEGNQYVLGAIAVPDMLLTLDHCINLIRLWYWFAALAGYFHRDVIHRHDPSFGRDYLEVAKDAHEVIDWLAGEFNRLLEESDRSDPPAVGL